MGLDMYLYAERTFDPKDADTKAMVAAAEASLDELVIRASLDPNTPPHWESDKYISGWDHSDAHEVGIYNDTLRVAGLSNLRTDDSPAIHLGFRSDDAESPWKGKVYVRSVALYWRKANAIHRWFVENIQDGVDECQLSQAVSPFRLRELQAICEEALEAYEDDRHEDARNVLEPTGGFFFGSTDLDEWWAEDARRTINEIDSILAEAKNVGGVTFYYQSSW